jgi:hypothetical protein
MRLKPRLSGRFAPDDRLCGRRGSVHAGGRPAKSRPEAISIAERQGGRRGSVHAGGRPAKSRPEAISIAERLLNLHNLGLHSTGSGFARHGALAAQRVHIVNGIIGADMERKAERGSVYAQSCHPDPPQRWRHRRGSVHAGGRPAKSRPEAISIAERQGSLSSGMRLQPRLSGRSTPVAVAASTQADARRKAVQRRFQSLNAKAA